MAGALTAAIASIFSGSAVTTDPYFEYTTLLLPGSGTNGAQNNSFLDGSTNNFTITRNGNTTQGTFSPFSQTGWGAYFDGTGDYLYIDPASALNLQSGAFTIEFWVFRNSGGVVQTLLSNYQSSAAGYGISVNASNKLTVNLSGDAPDITGTTDVPINQWFHVALSGTPSSSIKLFLNGVQESSTYTGATSLDSTRRTAIGAFWYFFDGNLYDPLPGYISNLRILKGTALYTANFTPPTAPLTAISGTSLLTCQSNRFIDNSSNNFTITRNGDTRVVAFSPFNPTSSWSAATNGGSGYFDGSGDYLSVADNDAFALGSNDWTIECWVYVSSLSAQGFIAQVASNGADSTLGFILGINASGYPYVASYINGAYTAATASTAIVTNQWNHIAGSRASGTMGVFLNGSRLASTAVSGSSVNSTATVTVGASQSGSSALTTGYIANARIVNGTAVYSGTTYTVPTAPLTAITNTSLLLNFTNAGIYDATSKNDLETVGDAQISNTTAKWGSTSIKFDGTGDYLQATDRQTAQFGSGNWTVEGWINWSSLTGARAIFNYGYETTTTRAILIYTNGTNVRVVQSPDGSTSYDQSLGSPSLSTGTWYHLAVVRNGATVTCYIDGTATGTTATAYTISTAAGAVRIGTESTSYFNGYIQDLRVTKGYARYTANFTPPTAAFPTL